MELRKNGQICFTPAGSVGTVTALPTCLKRQESPKRHPPDAKNLHKSLGGPPVAGAPASPLEVCVMCPVGAAAAGVFVISPYPVGVKTDTAVLLVELVELSAATSRDARSVAT